MASRTTNPPDHPESSSAMHAGDVEAIGAHCQMEFCRQLDFLPFTCESCRRTYCRSHRTESAHQCPNEGAWARRRTEANRGPVSNIPLTPRPNILNHEQQCSESSCKTLINTPLVTGVHCDKCRRSYCLKHRFTDDHDCANLQPLGTGKDGAKTQKEKGLAALEKFKLWGASKKASLPKPAIPQTKAKQAAAKSAATNLAEMATLKKTAKGMDSIPQDKRIYVYVEASSERITAKIPKGNFFYNKEFSVGRVLDLAAKSLRVQNINNMSDKEEDKLRIFHVEGGRLLEFNEKLGQGVATGNTIVIIRGLRVGMPATPANMQ